jgi:hypothetical protein
MAGLFICAGCTESPFGESKIAPAPRQIRGRIALSRNLNPSGAFVWLEGVNIGTRADKNGAFAMTLPPAAGQNVRGGLNGVFNLYFYLANFELTAVPVILRKGAFVYSQGEIDSDGDLNMTKFMPEFLQINTVVKPAAVPASFQDTVLVEVKLKAVSDSVSVAFPLSFAGRFGALFFRNLGSGQVFVLPLFPGIMFDHVEVIGRATYTTRAVFYPGRMRLPQAKYEVIPYLLVKHEAVPPELIESLGENVEALGLDYLKIPFAREGGSFEVQ